MNPQHIIDLCEANWDANKGDCNHFVKAVADSLGVTIFATGDDADAIMDKLSNAAGWSSIPSAADLSAVENAAAAGQFLIAGLKSGDFNPPRQHGHVVVIVKGDDPIHPGYPMAYWGQLGGVGQKDSSIRNSFTPGKDLKKVTYYGTALQDAVEAVSFAEQFAPPNSLSDVRTAVESLVSRIVDSLGKSPESDQKERMFFPNGIERLEIEVKAGPVDVSIKISGPKAS